MRNLFLVRHAKSSWDTPGLRDFDRPLNKRGLKDAPEMAALLRGMHIKPDLMISSPANRALTTARFFANGLGFGEAAVIQNKDIYEAYPSVILRIISALPDAAQTVFLFGHNPTFTDVANNFTRDHIDNVPTCGVVHIESSAEHWALLDEENARVKACYFPKEVL
ncbi:MAG: histidine phosphatase family protein [Lewinellaceae bacterium]|nr:histidine phosphatase family protein [Lewinellaceae bacterium]